VLIVASMPVRGTGIGADLCEQVRMCYIVWISNTKTNLMSNCWRNKYLDLDPDFHAHSFLIGFVCAVF